MMRKILISVLLVSLLPASAVCAPHRAVVQYKAEIAKGEYSKALMALHRAVRTSRNLTTQETFDIWVEEATFYQKYVGDIDHALFVLEKVRPQASSLGIDHQKILEDKIQVLENLLEAHRDEKAFVDRFVALEPKEQMTMADNVRHRIEIAAANSPYLGALNHCLGVAHFEAERYRPAYNAFETALALTPAIFFKHPTRELQKKALVLWKERALPSIAKISASFLLGLIALGLLWTRPRKWIRWSHLAPLPLLLLFWAIAHRVVVAMSSKLADDTVQKGGDAIVNTEAGSVMSAPLTSHLFVYGAFAMLGIYLASLVISRIKGPVTRYAANVCAGFCITGTLMLCFVLSHGETQIAPRQGSSFQHMFSSFQYELTDPVPYLLSSPKDYPGLDVGGIDESVLREYLEQMNYSEENADE